MCQKQAAQVRYKGVETSGRGSTSQEPQGTAWQSCLNKVRNTSSLRRIREQTHAPDLGDTSYWAWNFGLFVFVWTARFSPPDRKGLLDFMLESAFAMLLHHAPIQYPARADRQWIPPSILPEWLASGSRRVSQSSSPVDPAEYPRVARQWIPPSSPLSIPCRWILPSIR